MAYKIANFLTGGTPSASNASNGAASNAVDGNTGTRWAVNNYSAGNNWWKYDLGVGVTKTAVYTRYYGASSTWDIKDMRIEGSNNDSTWTTLLDWNNIPLATQWNTSAISNSTAYRYYRVIVDLNHGAGTEAGMYEFELYETSDIKRYLGATRDNLKKVNGIAIASVKKLMGVQN